MEKGGLCAAPMPEHRQLGVNYFYAYDLKLYTECMHIKFELFMRPTRKCRMHKNEKNAGDINKHICVNCFPTWLIQCGHASGVSAEQEFPHI